MLKINRDQFKVPQIVLPESVKAISIIPGRNQGYGRLMLFAVTRRLNT